MYSRMCCNTIMSYPGVQLTYRLSTSPMDTGYILYLVSVFQNYYSVSHDFMCVASLPSLTLMHANTHRETVVAYMIILRREKTIHLDIIRNLRICFKYIFLMY